jgi:putative transposase
MGKGAAMKKRAAVTGRKQEKTPVTMSVGMQQVMLPLLLAMEATKKGLLSFVQQMGMVVLSELLVAEAAQIAGPKGKHVEGRTHHHWGTSTTPVCFGGRHVSLPHPRVRARGKGKGAEVTLPSIETLRDGDPMSARVAEQIALGVSTRGYERSLEPVDETIETRGASKSNASRSLIDATTDKLAQFVSRKLDDVDLVAMFIDGIEFAGHSVLIALGVTIDGTKTPLGIWAGSTENTTVVTELLSNLVARGLRVEESMLFVIDGGKAIRKALRDVFGDRAIVQRCQVHKARNVRDHLPESRRAYVAKQMRDAYNSTTAATAKKKLMQLASWLASNGEDSAAASLREGLDETLTVMRLALPKTLQRTFATTNAIENMNGSLRRIARNVKRWKDETMIRRRVALGIAEAQKGFRRVKGHKDMPALVAAIRTTTAPVAIEKKVA